jgi:hypothetical protein
VGYHQANATTAAVNHAIWFGSTGVRWRANANCSWEEIPNAVVHGEFVRWVTKGTNPQTKVKAIQRTVFVTGLTVPINSQIQIANCQHTYTVVESNQHSDRFGLTCQRADTAEITRPNYRHPMGGQ